MIGTLISISGPTSVGKTSVSIYLAKNLKTEIFSFDARQFYNELKIGTGIKNKKELKLVHFIGHRSIFKKYNIANFEIEALKQINYLLRKYKIILMVGGSGLYEKSVIQGLDSFPTVHYYIREELKNLFKKQGISTLQKELQSFDQNYYKKINQKNPHQLLRALEVIRYSKKTFDYFWHKKFIHRTFKVIQIGLTLDRQELDLRIINRVKNMITNGLLEEASELYHYKHLNGLNTLGYKEVFKFFDGIHKLEKSIEEIKKQTKNYAKSQLTWDRNIQNLIWFSPNKKEKILGFLKNKLNLE